jgi:kynurenine formamidase
MTRQWTTMTKKQRTESFEDIGLSGLFFNEDHEENWATYEYGECDYNKLTKPMQEFLQKRGIEA